MNQSLSILYLVLTAMLLLSPTMAVCRRPDPFVRNADSPYPVTEGLQDRCIALWHSHGLYYDQRDDRWKWQRARVMTTVEDKYTMSYVLPYLLPMLERAGANVFLPRERDTQRYEYIVDNDTSEFTGGVYREILLAPEQGRKHKAKSRSYGFTTAGRAGFGLKRAMYVDRQNPFAEGTFRRHETKGHITAYAQWIPDISESGWYWVSVAYATTEHSVPDACYTVYHAAGATHFTVDQRRGGGTWIYLGQFYFEAGADETRASVVLDNCSGHDGEITADAVRFGGGMGCIGRRPAGPEEKSLYKGDMIPCTDTMQCCAKEEYETSGVPRFLEAARYYMQWAGVPYAIYSGSQSMNDYRDDYNCRPMWANWLMYGSESAPDSSGLGFDLDAAIAFHSDAGTAVDSIIGTMGIYTSRGMGRTTEFPNGKSRKISGLLAESVVNQIVADIRALHCTRWTDRLCHDRNYAETRRAEVPAMILELLSHQNYDDMRYGLDPAFRFTVSRAVYKGVARFIARQNNLSCVIAPLPVTGFAIETADDGDSLLLSWHPVIDTVEATAVPAAYILYTSVGGKGWDNGTLVDTTFVKVPFVENLHMLYRVTAVNAGGESLDSEILSAHRTRYGKGTVMVVNGFDRVAAPEGFSSVPYVGFPSWMDNGVPDGRDWLYVGAQHDFDTRNPWITDDNAGWGQSDSDFEISPPVGNTHDYPLLHGKSIVAAGYSYVSCSHTALSDSFGLSAYPVVDIILGEQRCTFSGPDSTTVRFKTFPDNLQTVLRRYTSQGGALLVTGAHVVSDSWMSPAATDDDRRFVNEVLRVGWRTDRASQNGRVSATAVPVYSGEWMFSQHPNDSVYAVESPDALVPAHRNAHTVLRYTQNTNSAAVACDADGYRTIVCGFPFETVMDAGDRNRFMCLTLHYLLNGEHIGSQLEKH